MTPKKTGEKNQPTVTRTGKLTKPQMEHELKLALMRDCQIYGKDFENTKLYFNSKGYTLGSTQFTNLRNELKDTKTNSEWFTKEALYAIEDDHKLSVERIRMMENRLLAEFEQVSATNYYKYLNAGTKKQEIIKNKVHDSHLFLRIIAQFQSLQETKTKMFSATPLVQEMMEVASRREQEDEVLSMPSKREKKEEEKEIKTK